MIARGDFWRGAVLASLAAGPLFLASLALAAWATSPPVPLRVLAADEWFGGGLLVAAISVPFGFVFSAVPNIVASWMMHRLGCENAAARLPVMWALAGSGLAGLPLVLIAESDASGKMIIMAFALAGGSCGLVAHRFARWDRNWAA